MSNEKYAIVRKLGCNLMRILLFFTIDVHLEKKRKAAYLVEVKRTKMVGKDKKVHHTMVKAGINIMNDII